MVLGLSYPLFGRPLTILNEMKSLIEQKRDNLKRNRATHEIDADFIKNVKKLNGEINLGVYKKDKQFYEEKRNEYIQRFNNLESDDKRKKERKTNEIERLASEFEPLGDSPTKVELTWFDDENEYDDEDDSDDEPKSTSPHSDDSDSNVEFTWYD